MRLLAPPHPLLGNPISAPPTALEVERNIEAISDGRLGLSEPHRSRESYRATGRASMNAVLLHTASGQRHLFTALAAPKRLGVLGAM